MSKANVYEIVTNRIIEGLQDKGLSWFRPWTNSNGDFQLPINNTTGKAYNGVNLFILGATATIEGYEHNEWITFKQAINKGGQVLKGSKSTEVVFWNISYKFEGKFYPNRKALEGAGLTEDTKGVEKLFTPRYYRVFNIAQCEGIEPRRKPNVKDDTPNVFGAIDTAEQVYEGYVGKPTLKHGGGRAYYRPSTHHVQMPTKDSFVTSDDYYKTLFHELVHSTGHKDILNRKTLVENNGFGSVTYSKEELVAEIGSEFLVAITGINPKDDGRNAQAYINGWVKYLKDHPKEIMGASTQAIKSVERMLTK
jgi:antirestriction protein ArdC